MLCPISALNPCGGPGRLIDCLDLRPTSAQIATEIMRYGHVSLGHTELMGIVYDTLQLTLPPADSPEIYDLAPPLPEGISDWIHFTPIGIGHFDADGASTLDNNRKYPSGRNVEIRRLAEYHGYGYFGAVIEEDEEVPKQSCCRPLTDCSFFILKGPLEYLRAWLDPALPPRIAFMDLVPSMTLEGELFEILNSRHQKRGAHFRFSVPKWYQSALEINGLLPDVEYGDIAETLEMEQFRFLNSRKDSHHLSRAIGAGLRGSELLPALFSDFQCWQSMRPDIWPVPVDTEPITVFTAHPDTPIDEGNPFKTLPNELLLEILRRLPISSILTLSSASRSLRGLITQPAFMNQVFKTAVLSGSEHWVLPVDSLAGEKKRAWDAASEWLRDACLTESPFLSSTFPYLPFLKACYASDSMRNRQRLWRVVKQLDDIWRDYRLNGWQRKAVFSDP